MTEILTIFFTLIYITDYTYVSTSYLESEENLVHCLNVYIEEREIYLYRVTRHLRTIEASSKNLKYGEYTQSAEDAKRRTWKQFLIFKRIVIDWINFLNNLHDDTNVVNSIESSIWKTDNEEFSDWIYKENDVKLLEYVQNLINISKTETQITHTKTYNKRSEDSQHLRKQLKENVIESTQNFKMILRQFIYVTRYVPLKPFSYLDNYRKLCRREKLLQDNHKNLRCSYAHNNKPYLLIGPIKREVLHVDPQIIMFHDVLFNSEIEQIQTLIARHPMYLQKEKNTKYRVAKVRLVDANSLRGVTQRMELFSNLNMTSSELYQIAVYGLGGHDYPHYDSGTDESHPIYSRMSTIMFYMTDVDKGGATVFPRLKVAVSPKKGSALFWYNIKPNFETDFRMIHAGCPVYSGLKWILNSWIHHDEQEFKVPCIAGHEHSFVN